jgi:hypothetical protein
MNANAPEYIPTSHIQATLWAMPFFQQRLERFVFSTFRIQNAKVEDLRVLLFHPVIPAQKVNATTLFLGAYGDKAFVYEAIRWDDPRTGVFRCL